MQLDLLAAGKWLLSRGGRVTSLGSRLWAERSAGRSDRAVEMALLRSELNATYDRLAAFQNDDAWWRGVLTTLGHAFVTPEFLKAPSRQEWLAEARTREGLLRVAESRALVRPDDDAEVRRLIASYQAKRARRTTSRRVRSKRCSTC